MSMNWISRLARATGQDLQAGGAHPCRVPRPRRGRVRTRDRTDTDSLPAPCVMRRAARQRRCCVGLTGYGLSMAMMVRAGLGLDPWDVFHQGLALQTGMTIGIASAVVGVAVLLAWIPLRNRPGIGTVANVIVIAITVDAGLAILPTPTSLAGAGRDDGGRGRAQRDQHGALHRRRPRPGPRDGLMTGLVVRTGLSVRLVRTSIEATVLAVGWLLGGTVGVGTVVVRVRDRPAGPVLRADHAAAGAGRQRLGSRREASATPRRRGGRRRCSRPACWSIRPCLRGHLARAGTIWSRRVARGSDRA